MRFSAMTHLAQTVRRTRSDRRNRGVAVATGFTLIELLVVVSIIALLLAMLAPLLVSAKQYARMTKEMAAGRAAATGWHQYAADHNDRLLEGVASPSGTVAYDQEGRTLGGPIASRYPWRLAPYLEHQLGGTLLVNDREAVWESGPGEDPLGWAYGVSVMPSFGINAIEVGGHYLHPGEAVKKMPGVRHPSDLIVFASARFYVGFGQPTPGYFEVRQPIVNEYNPTASAHEFGFVDPRWWDQAVTVQADASVDVLDAKQLTQSHRWINQ